MGGVSKLFGGGGQGSGGRQQARFYFTDINRPWELIQENDTGSGMSVANEADTNELIYDTRMIRRPKESAGVRAAESAAATQGAGISVAQPQTELMAGRTSTPTRKREEQRKSGLLGNSAMRSLLGI
jgi:hypothetical protein